MAKVGQTTSSKEVVPVEKIGKRLLLLWNFTSYNGTAPRVAPGTACVTAAANWRNNSSRGQHRRRDGGGNPLPEVAGPGRAAHRMGELVGGGREALTGGATSATGMKIHRRSNINNTQ